MTRHHFFGPAPVGGVLVLDGPEGHHAARVRRVRVGEEITVGDGEGTVWTARVTAVSDVVEASVTRTEVVQRAEPAITLLQAVGKQDATEEAIARAVELGVTTIVPFLSARTIVNWDAAKREKAHQRFVEIAHAAAKQSLSPWLCRVEPVDTALPTVHGYTIALHPEAPALELPEQRPTEVSLVVGPEGGLDDDELRRLDDGGAVRASVGRRVLRTQTAGGAVAFLIRGIYGAL